MKQMKMVLTWMLVALTLLGTCVAFAEPAQPDKGTIEREEVVAAEEPIPESTPETTETPGSDPTPEPPAPTLQTLYTKKKINLYKAKKTSSKILAKIPNKTEVEAGPKGKSWTQVTYDGKVGFVKSANLTATDRKSVV